MPALRAELMSSGKTTTGFEIPEEFVDRLGGGRRPKVRVRLEGSEFGTSIAPIGGRFMLGVSAERREASGVVAGQTYDIEIELDTAPRESGRAGGLRRRTGGGAGREGVLRLVVLLEPVVARAPDHGRQAGRDPRPPDRHVGGEAGAGKGSVGE